MPFDPTLPLDNSTASAPQLRSQLTALKALIDAQAAQIAAHSAQITTLTNQVAALPTLGQVQANITALSAQNMDGLAQLSLGFSDPVAEPEATLLMDKVNELIAALTH